MSTEDIQNRYLFNGKELIVTPQLPSSEMFRDEYKAYSIPVHPSLAALWTESGEKIRGKDFELQYEVKSSLLYPLKWEDTPQRSYELTKQNHRRITAIPLKEQGEVHPGFVVSGGLRDIDEVGGKGLQFDPQPSPVQSEVKEQGGWISDRLPEKKEKSSYSLDVLVSLDNDTMQWCAIDRYDCIAKYWEKWNAPEIKVLGWQPLPQPLPSPPLKSSPK